MKIITSIATSYRADDGTVFLTKELCIAHEQLCQLQTVIKEQWPTFFRNDTATVATMLIATWDQLCDAMEIQSEEMISNTPLVYDPAQRDTPKRGNPAAVVDWYKEYPELNPNVIEGAMANAMHASAAEHTIGSEEYSTMCTVELTRLLDQFADALRAQKIEAGIDYHNDLGQYNQPPARRFVVDRNGKRLVDIVK